MNTIALHRQGGATRGYLAGGAMVALFLSFYVVAFIDRQVINMMVKPIQAQMGFSELQMSWLMGPSFGLFFALCGLLMGGLIDRFSRRWLTTGAIVVWGLATCLCGLAGTFPILLLGRMGVGVGESALTPAAHSLITEQFPRERLSTALATYSLGSVIGTGIATILGGQLVHLIAEGNPAVVPVIGTVQPWQMVFLAVGIPTVILAPLALLVKERIDRGRKSVETQGAGMSIAAFFAFCMKNPRLFFGLPIAFGMLNIITNSLLSWVPTFMQRTYGWNIANIGLAWGTEHIIAGAIGQIGGAMLVDRLYARGVADAHVRYQWMGVLIGVPATIIGLLSGNPWIFLGTMAIYSVLCYPFLGYAVAALQLHTPSHLRGRMSAWFYAVITVIGSLIGAPITAFITQSVFVDKAKIGLSMVTVMAIFAPLVVLMLMWVGSNLRATHASRGQ
ncbi:MFS transporter [Sphingomonas sp. CL5.1]|uniref:MFS transporter n=1 Tax=Sphingomonas sp. CL5.1 TaxID=2653203 RepID=UPI001583F89E|nr:MFS transporter [Sphingomonas sp. CL5.1]QKS00342.1 MFS transporter [Sphingomonas sp. CL5.1]